MKVVIVESPAKAKTINKYLGKDYGVYASFGHVRDLAAKDGSVDPDDDFAMRWEVDAKAAKRLSDIGGAVKNADRVILATDPDREGEAISWHIHEILKGKKLLKDKRVDRVVFNAVTKDAVQEAMRHPREIDEALVDAYRARRALDYLVGFTLSPVLWRKLPGARSAGRVQSVALRIICDRELEIERFAPREYWSIVAHLLTEAKAPFTARLVGADGKKINRLDVGSGGGDGAVLGRGDRIEAGQAPPLSALHHFDLAAGGVAQARPRPGAHDASCATALRGRRRRRRRGRPHHLYAHRRRRPRPRGGCGSAPRHRQGFRRRLCAGRPAQIHRQGQERAGGARGDPPDRHDPAPARRRPPSRARAGQTLRTHLDTHHRQPDGERRARAHHGRHSGGSGRTQA